MTGAFYGLILYLKLFSGLLQLYSFCQEFIWRFAVETLALMKKLGEKLKQML